MERQFLLGHEAARRLRVSRRTVSAWIEKGIVQTRKDARGWNWIPIAEVERLRRLRLRRQLPRRDTPRFAEAKG